MFKARATPFGDEYLSTDNEEPFLGARIESMVSAGCGEWEIENALRHMAPGPRRFLRSRRREALLGWLRSFRPQPAADKGYSQTPVPLPRTGR